MNMGNNIWRSIFAILLGLALVIWPDVALNYIVIIIGVILLLTGITTYANYYSLKRRGFDLPALPVESIVSLIFGLLLIIMPSVFVSILMLVLGILLVIASLGQLSGLISARRNGIDIPGVLYIFPILILIAGIVVMFNPFASAATVFIFFGITSIVYGIVNLFSLYAIRPRK